MCIRDRERADILQNLVATVTEIEGMDYRSIASVPSEDDKSLKPVSYTHLIKWDKIRSESDRFSNISKKLSQHADTVLNVANKLEISDDVKELDVYKRQA